MPTIVMHQTSPTQIDAMANSQPKNTIHIMFTKNLLIILLYSMLLPNGYNTKPENLRHCIPIGIPIIVKKHIIATVNHNTDRINPPNMIQKTLPNIFIYVVAFVIFIGIIAFSNTIEIANTTAIKI